MKTAIKVSVVLCLFCLISKNVLAQDFYVIQPGDSLAKIAMLFSTSVEKLCQLNDIADDQIIKVGYQLRIPQTGTVKKDSKPVDLVDLKETKTDSGFLKIVWLTSMWLLILFLIFINLKKIYSSKKEVISKPEEKEPKSKPIEEKKDKKEETTFCPYCHDEIKLKNFNRHISRHQQSNQTTFGCFLCSSLGGQEIQVPKTELFDHLDLCHASIAQTLFDRIKPSQKE